MNDLELLWSAPFEQWRLDGSDLHVWSASLDKTPDRVAALEPILSPDERDRAMRFHFEPDRNRFIVGRGTLRKIIGSYVNVDPAQLHFSYSKKGKPELTGLAPAQTLQFNLAHSNQLMLVALTRIGIVGIDVEWMPRTVDIESVAHQFFDDCEYEALMAQPDDRRSLAFFNLWTRKEAYLKATGSGLGDLNRITVSFLPGEPARIVSVEDDRQGAGSWSVIDLTPASRYKGAVVAAAKRVKLHCWQWPL
jgi:4'-phosphopantetheinyl transferase